ncbi:acyl-CoA carboxylase subunit beta [Oceanibacterium hippocampi]|uniref:Putative propionyl-CoA carboxylase beta chain 5 n=1 Tax=Oceanibacterium hippocampi TaxID=745714 RepID=A0A1Y5U046_9PROT|nr:carboxyl transferase domain-containing protein [Oceanibacterium hippocampi]SLN77194.1 putative propionyl-CoA carboxylase beta chain 5 [Oceanibacterium hippocampi]
MSWDEEAGRIAARRLAAKAQGGEDAVRRQHEKGRLTIRERIAGLADAESFREHGPGAGSAETAPDGTVRFTPANYVTGLAEIDGRRIAVAGEDFTLKGGSPNAAGLRKSIYAEHLAMQYRVPLVRFLEGGGGSVAGAGKGPAGPVGDPVFNAPRFRSIADVLSEVPVVSAALGPVAGFPAARLVASHFSVMTRKTAQVLIAGPAVVKRALGHDLDKEALGGAAVHGRNGVVDNVVDDEAAAFDQIRRFLGYLPSNIDERAPRIATDDPSGRREEKLLNAVPRERRKAFDMRIILRAVLDRDNFFEIGPGYGRGIITGLGRIAGQPLAVLGNDCRFYAGAMTADGARKLRKMVEIADLFHLPIVSFVDEPGFMIGPDAEAAATIRAGTAAVAAVAQSVVPWATVIVHKSFGVAAAAHYGPDGHVLAWPSAAVGALPVEGGVAVAFHREIAAAEDPDARRKELEDALAARQSAFPRAESFAFHDLIDPRETRPALADWVEWIQPRLKTLTGPVRFGYRP